MLAAHRAGLTEVILPARNGPDLEDVPEAVQEQMTFHLASDISEVLHHALAGAGEAHTFRDHYLDVDLDLSNVLFLATANMAEQIPGALLDRMEVVRLDGYTEDEKVVIGRDHLLRRQLEANGLTADEV